MNSFGVAEKLSHEDFRSREAVGRQRLWRGQEAFAERFPMRVPNGRILSLSLTLPEELSRPCGRSHSGDISPASACPLRVLADGYAWLRTHVRLPLRGCNALMQCLD